MPTSKGRARTGAPASEVATVGATPSAVATAATGGAPSGDDALPVGTSAGRYVLTSRVGAGGLGQV